MFRPVVLNIFLRTNDNSSEVDIGRVAHRMLMRSPNPSAQAVFFSHCPFIREPLPRKRSTITVLRRKRFAAPRRSNTARSTLDWFDPSADMLRRTSARQTSHSVCQCGCGMRGRRLSELSCRPPGSGVSYTPDVRRRVDAQGAK
eukprot:scaffold2213_cov143-Isochrysis_galbana.AAC.5